MTFSARTRARTRTQRARENPRVGRHPSLFEEGQTPVIVEDWRLLTADELRSAAALGELGEDDYSEMEDYVEQARLDGDISALLKDGLSRQLAQALVAPKEVYFVEGKKVKKTPLVEELKDLDEDGREKRIEPFVEYMRDAGNALVEREVVNEAGEVSESIVDVFQSDLEETSMSALIKAAKEVYEDFDFDAVDQTALEEVLRDPGNFDFEVQDQYGRGTPGEVWGWNIGTLHDQSDGAKHDEHLRAILHGGEYEWTEHPGDGPPVKRSESFPGLTDEDLDHAFEELENNEPYVSVGSSSRRKEMSVEDLDSSFDIQVFKHDSDRAVAFYDGGKLADALSEIAEVEVGPQSDNVVYTYPGTNEFVSGASARGMYVAQLAPKDLRRESTMLGHCIGAEKHGHPAALRAGETRIYSIRTEAGKAKFTIELRRVHNRALLEGAKLWDGQPVIDDGYHFLRIAEVKGKANRLPGFEPGKNTLTKPDDVRLVTDFLLYLGFEPSAIRQARDTAPGVVAMEESGVNPFKPPPKRERKPPSTQIPPTQNPSRGVSSKVRALLAKALAEPMTIYRPARGR